jgi:hypothetical protein
MNFSFKLMTRRHDDVLERIAAAVRRVNAEVSRCAVELACAQTHENVSSYGCLRVISATDK